MKKDFSMAVYSFQEVTPINLGFVKGGTTKGVCCDENYGCNCNDFCKDNKSGCGSQTVG